MTFRDRLEAARADRQAGTPDTGTDVDATGTTHWVAVCLTVLLLTGAFLAWKWDHTWWTWGFLAAAILTSLRIPSGSGQTDKPTA